MAKLKQLLKTYFLKINEMKIRELLILIAITVIVGYSLTTMSIHESSIDPLRIITDSISGLLNLLKQLFFGWLN
jgi:hypothetical protein